MMAVISDIHGNEEALAAVARACDEVGVTRILCLGDVVGYGASPQACVERLMRWKQEGRLAACLKGNHDEAVLDPAATSSFNPVASVAIDWTRSALDDTGRRFLAQCPVRFDEDAYSAVHACWSRPQDWMYLFTPMQMAAEIGCFDRRWGFFGHTHRAGGIVLGSGGRRRPAVEDPVVLEPDERAVLNPGAVGQPRDGDPRASFIVFDERKATARWHRVPYDIDAAASKIIAAGLPRVLAERLREGW